MVKANGNKDIKVFDVVCGMELDMADVKYSLEHKGETYYFCSKSCKDHFVENPGRYAFRVE